jgi:hypothetical protein
MNWHQKFFGICFALCGWVGLANLGWSQEVTQPSPWAKRNNVTLNGLIAGPASLGYERLLYQSGRHKLFGALNLGAFPLVESSAPFPHRVGWYFSGGLGLNYSITTSRRNQNHHFDAGFYHHLARQQVLNGLQRDYNFSWIDGSRINEVYEDVYWGTLNSHVIAPRIGYRYQRPQGGFTWRAGLHPFFVNLPGHWSGFGFEWLPIPHASLGWSF